jgi:hypothetical protein
MGWGGWQLGEAGGEAVGEAIVLGLRGCGCVWDACGMGGGLSVGRAAPLVADYCTEQPIVRGVAHFIRLCL